MNCATYPKSFGVQTLRSVPNELVQTHTNHLYVCTNELCTKTQIIWGTNCCNLYQMNWTDNSPNELV